MKIQSVRLGSVSVLLGCMLWLGLAVAASMFLFSVERISGPGTQGPVSWPEGSKLRRTPGNFSLIMFVHPKCPCTNATMTELTVLMTHCPQLKSYVFFFRPDDSEKDWEKSTTWYRAKNIPGVTILADDGGLEAMRFHAKTSGQTMLFDASGKLIFAGGITDGRGHEGENQGLLAIESLIARPNSDGYKQTPVFGCSLHDCPSPNSELFSLCKK